MTEPEKPWWRQLDGLPPSPDARRRSWQRRYDLSLARERVRRDRDEESIGELAALEGSSWLPWPVAIFGVLIALFVFGKRRTSHRP